MDWGVLLKETESLMTKGLLLELLFLLETPGQTENQGHKRMADASCFILGLKLLTQQQ